MPPRITRQVAMLLRGTLTCRHLPDDMVMTQKPTYEFEEDDAPKPERKRFSPVLESETIPAPTVTAVPVAPAKALSPVNAAPAPAPAPPAADVDDPDLKPGSRKDLWMCPHCGTGNKPERTTCRSCGKSPSDPLEMPMWKKPIVIAGVLGGILLLIVIWVLMKPSLALKPPEAASLDHKIRRGSAQTHVRELVGKTFTPAGRLAVTGRICIARPLPTTEGVTSVVLLLGSAASDENLASAKVTFNNQLIENLPDHAVVLNLITTAKLDLKPGAWLSIVGDYGDLSDPTQLVHSQDQGDTVAVDDVRQ